MDQRPKKLKRSSSPVRLPASVWLSRGVLLRRDASIGLLARGRTGLVCRFGFRFGYRFGAGCDLIGGGRRIHFTAQPHGREMVKKDDHTDEYYQKNREKRVGL